MTVGTPKPTPAYAPKRPGTSTLRYLLVFVVILLILKSFFHASISIVGSLVVTLLVSVVLRSFGTR